MLKVVRPLLDLAYEREYMERNPHSWVQKRRVERRHDVDPFSFEEMIAFLTALPAPKWVRFYTVAFGTGLRTSEQFALQWRHVDFPHKVLHIEQGYVKGRMTMLKTEGSRRAVDMLPHVYDVLQEHYTEALTKHSAHDLATRLVFSNSDGGPLHRDNMRNRLWNPAIARAGLRERNPYQTRHTFASLMLYKHEDPAWVSRMLGHASLEMVYTLYGKFIPNRERQDGLAFSAAFTETQAKLSVRCP
jgi:integrase